MEISLVRRQVKINSAPNKYLNINKLLIFFSDENFKVCNFFVISYRKLKDDEYKSSNKE